MELILHNIALAAGTLTPILYGLLIAAGIDTLTGLWAAANSDTLNGQYVAEFVRSHILQRIAPIMMAIVTGVAVGGTDTAAGAALIATASAAGVAYLGEVVASVMANIADGRAKTKGLPKR